MLPLQDRIEESLLLVQQVDQLGDVQQHVLISHRFIVVLLKVDVEAREQAMKQDQPLFAIITEEHVERADCSSDDFLVRYFGEAVHEPLDDPCEHLRELESLLFLEKVLLRHAEQVEAKFLDICHFCCGEHRLERHFSQPALEHDSHVQLLLEEAHVEDELVNGLRAATQCF